MRLRLALALRCRIRLAVLLTWQIARFRRPDRYPQAPQLPDTGTVTAGSLYRYDNLLWSVIQTFSRTTYSAHPSTYPALIRRIAEPGTTPAWWQPLDANDAPKLVNPFTGKPDQRTHGGFTWKVTGADGSGNNTWEPGVFGWTKV